MALRLDIRPEEISSIIKKQIRDYENKSAEAETGTVITAGDGIVRAFGLDNCMANELVRFEGGEYGMAMNLEEQTVAIVMLDDSEHIREGTKVYRTGSVVSVPVGDGMVGRIVNALGQPIDGKGPTGCTETRPIESEAPGIIKRKSVSVPLQTGIKAIDSILNQKDTGVICVYVAIGQKNATVANVAETLRKNGADRYSVIVAATASEAAPLQYIAPYSGCAIAEYFMAQGKDVLIVYDDLSKHAVAYRALSLLIRRPPGREAFPGDVFYLHSRLLERAARLAPEFGGGSITALPIIETQAGDVSAYIPTNVISITDGQIFLETELFHSGVIPAVNPGISVSRVGGSAQIKAMKKTASSLRLLYSQFRELEAFAQFGSDLDADTKARLALGRRIVEVLKQDKNKPVPVAYQVGIIYAVVNGYLNDVQVEHVRRYEEELFVFLADNADELMKRIAETGQLPDEDKEALDAAIRRFTQKFRAEVYGVIDGEK